MTTDTNAENAAPSIVSILTNLVGGGTHGFIERLEGDAATKDAITTARVRLRNLAASAVSRAKAKTGYTYTVENGEIITRSLDIMIVVAVTRTA